MGSAHPVCGSGPSRCLLHLDEAQRGHHAVCKRMATTRVRARQVLFAEGAQAARVYFIQSGTVKLERLDVHAERHIVAILGPGDLFGLSALSEAWYGAEAETLTDCLICSCDADTLRSLMAEHPDFGVRLVTNLQQQLLRAQVKLTYMGHSKARTRLAAYLIDRGAQASFDGARVPRDLTLADMGAVLGLAPETVCRALGELKRKEVVETTREHILITDMAALRRLAD